MQLACRLLFVDLEGLNDGRATKTIIPKVAPRKLVSLVRSVRNHRILNVCLVKMIVHGGPAATEDFLESCANIRNMTKDIYAPAEGESVQIGQNTNSYSISLSDEMLASVRMSRVRHRCAITTALAHVQFFSSRTTRSASLQDGSPQVRARTYRCSKQPPNRPFPRAARPPRCCGRACSAQDQRSACPTRR